MAFALNREFGTGDKVQKIANCLQNYGLNPSSFEQDQFVEAVSNTFGISEEDAGTFFSKILNTGAIRPVSAPSVPSTAAPTSSTSKAGRMFSGILDISGFDLENLDPLPEKG